jgi:hypothetical protein
MGVQARAQNHSQTDQAGSPNFSEHVEVTRKTDRHMIDELLNRLQLSKDEWIRVKLADRISIIDEIRQNLSNVSEAWIQSELQAKGLPPHSFGEAEEWTILAGVFRALRTLKQSLIEIHKQGRPLIPGALTTRPDGQVVAQVFPVTLFDSILFRGITSEVWMEPGVSAEETLKSQASVYHDEHLKGKVALVLGAGNASVQPVGDLLNKMFVELQVVVLKPNPVNDHLGPLMEEAFRPLIDRDFLGLVYGGVEEGAYLCNHPIVDELHMTGSDKTFEAIVFGTGREGTKRKAERRPINTKRFTGELGNVSPVIVVPGPWTEADIQEQAKHIATWLAVNAGFACLTPRVIIQHDSWPHGINLMEEVGKNFENYPTRKAYYPGAEERHAEFLKAHPEARLYGSAKRGHLPWTIVPNADPENVDDICFKREAFCCLFAETTLEATSIGGFIDRAVEFSNETLWGTLCATIIVHPKSLVDPEIAEAVDRAIANLRYGTVSLNLLAYYSAFFMTAPWGGYPGSDMYDIQSGMGKSYNMLMFSHPQKSVTKAPFKRLDPITVKSKKAPEFSKMLAEFEANPSWRYLPGLAITALRA